MKRRKGFSYGKKRVNWSRVVLAGAGLFFAIFIVFSLVTRLPQVFKKQMTNVIGYTVEEINDYARKNNLEIEINYIYTIAEEKDLVIKQSIKNGTEIKRGDQLIITVSNGELDLDALKDMGVNELGKIPVIMYHGVQNITNSQTPNKNGNIDRNGYNRTAEAFREDLEMFYQLGYRPISLVDMANGKIDLPAGLSPLVLTFDDGLQNNFNVLGKDDKGKLIIDPNSAIGIMEEFNKKYPDYNITATFFLNGSFFGQKEYEEDKLKWLVENGYDVGNHTWGHENLSSANAELIQTTIGRVNAKIKSYLPDYEVKALALPFGSHPSKDSTDYETIFKGEYEGEEYNFDAVLAVGWEPERSPFADKFANNIAKSPGLIMRVRGSDKVGNDTWTDLNWIFNEYLPTKRYVSDGDPDIAVFPMNLEKFFNKAQFPKITVYPY